MWVFKRRNIFYKFLIILINLIIFLLFYFTSLNKTESIFIYPLDDSYIHLALAKNFLNHKEIGLNGNFASSTSSPLYTYLLSLLFLIFGAEPLIPLILNFVFSFILLLTFFKISENFLNPLSSFLFTIAFYFFIPIPTLTFSGLEHLIHILFLILILKFFLVSSFEEKKIYFFLFALSFLNASIRYESLFFLLPTTFLFILNKKLKEGFWVFLGTLTPVFIYGIYSKLKGWFFLPNSVLLKGYLFNFNVLENLFKNFYFKFYNELLKNPHLIPPLLFSLLVLFFYSQKKDLSQKFKSYLQFL